MVLETFKNVASKITLGGYMTIGRPREYKEVRECVSIYLAVQVKKRLREEAFKQGLSIIELVDGYITNGDPTEAAGISKKLQAMREAIVSLERQNEKILIQNKETQEKMQEIINLKNMPISGFYGEQKNDATINAIVERIKPEYKEKMKGKNQAWIDAMTDRYIDSVYEELEKEISNSGRFIKKPNEVRSAIKSLIMREV